RRELVLFLGAGVSQAAGLPSWSDLLKELAGADLASHLDFRTLSPLDQARVVQARLPKDSTLGQAVASRLGATHYSLAHALLAALPTMEAVTTNYDTLFEAASAAIRRRVDVLPYQAARGGRRWLLKLHGCVSRPGDIVLTREDYLRYDTSRAALAGLVQGLLITRHMLFVGFSLVDDNFHRIADAVRRAVKREPFGTSLSVAGNRLLRTALGRARRGDVVPRAGPRLARSFQAARGTTSPRRISEPETAARVANGKQNAGAALRRSGCRASS
ncbi:MAG TPA: SIR2 family protein, partial [Gemmataceae bacterium]|nr:SIR2 family protein [Gemmataceae bacterium]